MSDTNGETLPVFNISDGPIFMGNAEGPTGEQIFQTSPGGLTAVAPDGTAITFSNETVGINVLGKPGQCYFGGVIEKIG